MESDQSFCVKSIRSLQKNFRKLSFFGWLSRLKRFRLRSPKRRKTKCFMHGPSSHWAPNQAVRACSRQIIGGFLQALKVVDVIISAKNIQLGLNRRRNHLVASSGWMDSDLWHLSPLYSDWWNSWAQQEQWQKRFKSKQTVRHHHQLLQNHPSTFERKGPEPQ